MITRWIVYCILQYPPKKFNTLLETFHCIACNRDNDDIYTLNKYSLKESSSTASYDNCCIPGKSHPLYAAVLETINKHLKNTLSVGEFVYRIIYWRKARVSWFRTLRKCVNLYKTVPHIAVRATQLTEEARTLINKILYNKCNAYIVSILYIYQIHTYMECEFPLSGQSMSAFSFVELQW